MMDERTRRCPQCGGVTEDDEATMPFVLDRNNIVIVRHVPAERCHECGEAFTSGMVTDHIKVLLQRVKHLRSEVTVISYTITGAQSAAPPV